MMNIRKSMLLGAALLLSFASVEARRKKKCCDPIVGVWAINILDTNGNPQDYDNFIFMADGSLISHSTASLEQAAPPALPYGARTTIFTGFWKKTGKRTYTAVATGEFVAKDLTPGSNYLGIPVARFKNYFTFEIDKNNCDKLTGSGTGQAYAPDDIAFAQPLGEPETFPGIGQRLKQ